MHDLHRDRRWLPALQDRRSRPARTASTTMYDSTRVTPTPAIAASIAGSARFTTRRGRIGTTTARPPAPNDQRSMPPAAPANATQACRARSRGDLRHAVGGEIRGAGIDRAAHRADGDPSQRRVAQRGDADPQVETLVDQGHDVVPEREPHVDRGMATQELAHRRTDVQSAHDHRRGHPDHARRRVGRGAQRGVERRQLAEHRLRGGEIARAGVGERHRPRRAIQQARADAALEGGDGAGDRRRRAAEAACRADEAPGLGHRGEGLERFESVHHCTPRKREVRPARIVAAPPPAYL